MSRSRNGEAVAPQASGLDARDKEQKEMELSKRDYYFGGGLVLSAVSLGIDKKRSRHRDARPGKRNARPGTFQVQRALC
jgi:hypothetical protein